MSSKPPFEPLDLERDVPTSAADVAALARLRGRLQAGLLTDVDRLSPPSWLPQWPGMRKTSRGWAPFTL